MEFEDRLKKAIRRGHQRSEDRGRAKQEAALSVEELKGLHSKYRLELSERIEACVQSLPQHFPGFQTETIYGERGWGAACSRDDLSISSSGKRQNAYSRLEMMIRPYSSLNVVDLAAKGTIRNKEIFNRNHFQLIGEVDPDTFLTLIDAWVLEYAEQYAAT